MGFEQGKQVLVIGAGVSGLVCAYYLADSGIPVTVLEKNDYLGGLAACYTDDLHTPRTYHHILSSDKMLLEIIRKLDIKVNWRKVKIGFHYKGNSYPMSSPLDVLRFNVLNIFDRLRFGLLVLRARRSKALENTDLRDWVIKNAGKTVYEKLIDPLVSSYFGSADGITAAYLANRWKSESGSATDVIGYADVSQIIKKIAAYIEDKGGKITTGCEVTQIKRKDSSFDVSSPGGSFNFNYVVSTIPAPILANVCKDLPEPFIQQLSKIQYRGVICVTYWLPKKSSDYYWLIMLDKQSPFVACFEHANLNPYMPQGGLVYAVAYCASESEVWQMSDEEIARLFSRDLPKALKNFSQWTEFKVYRSAWATPVFVKGYWNPPLITPLPNLYLAGISRIFPDIRSMGPAMKTGVEAAQGVLSDMKREKK